MNEQEYKYIRNLAWDLLISAKVSELPIDINAIASLYNFQSKLSSSKSRYENTLIISHYILQLFGFNTDSHYAQYLATRILAPVVVLKTLNLQSVDELCKYTDLPYNIAYKRFERLKMLIQRDMFCTSNLEIKVLQQFSSWIESHK